MPQSHPSTDNAVAQFIARWNASESSERANYSMFLTELCRLLAVPGPDPARSDERENAYVFERTVPMNDGDGKTTTGFIDLYKRGCFVLEAKQGSEAAEDAVDLMFAPAGRSRRGTAVRGTAGWDVAMKKAKGQAERYVKSLPASEGNPPFIILVDVGHVFEVYADFSRLGKTYTPFPDSQTFRIYLKDLADESIRQRLARIWTDPLGLDPTRHSAKVTRVIADNLARLAKSFESAGHHPEVVAAFLMRCLFTFFAEDVGLIDRERTGEQPFTDLLKSLRGHTDQFIPMAQDVWSRMDAGGFSTAMRRKLRHFNGKLFKESQALPINDAQLELLIQAGQSDWSDVEPAIFGTLLERALEPRERHKLGAHYTPRAYVERLVLPTVIEPLREKWDAARAAAFTLNMQGKNDEARKAVHDFLGELCSTTVLDPACGSGNFLYVTMEHMKKLEGEVRDELAQLGETQGLLERGGLTVDPHQFLGLEINPRAVAIAELVLWIGYLKWHLRTLGHMPNEPLLRAFDNIKQQDAVLAYDSKEIVTDETGKPMTRWDGHTMKRSPVTGEEVPDETARVPLYRYTNARKAEWPKADYVVGNPPFIGKLYVARDLGVGYADTLRTAYSGDVPDSADFVMYWWRQAAALLASGAIEGFGFITTNSISQTFNRRVLHSALSGDGQISLVFAVPDHPWVDTADGAAVRIAMTAARRGPTPGRSMISTREEPGDEASTVAFSTRVGRINADLTVGTNLTLVRALRANDRLASMGPALGSRGFLVDATKRDQFIQSDGEQVARRIRPIRNGRDLIGAARGLFAIDLYGVEDEATVQRQFPATYQHLLTTVRPERLQNNDPKLRKYWWLFRRSNDDCRTMVSGLTRVIVTVETAKFRTFVFVESEILAEHGTISFGLDDAFFLGAMSSRHHVAWALATGGTLEDRPRYNKTICFDPFPFPACTEIQRESVRQIGESLDAHRKRQQALHPGLTITDMYNVLERLRKGEVLTPKDRQVHEQGLVSVLRQIHDDLDAAVADAYGWPADLPDEEILTRLVALNAERAEEEKRGLIRWLRPDFQNPAGASTEQPTLGMADAKPAKAKKTEKIAWPKSLAEQAQAVRSALTARPGPATPREMAGTFKDAKTDRVAELLATLAALGQARSVEGGRFVA